MVFCVLGPCTSKRVQSCLHLQGERIMQIRGGHKQASSFNVAGRPFVETVASASDPTEVSLARGHAGADG
jgi:hypothetical protein